MAVHLSTPGRRRAAVAVSAFALFAVGLAAGAALLHRSMREAARRDASARLEAIAALKAAALESERVEHVRDAAFAASYPTVAMVARQATRGRVDPHDAAHAREVLVHLAERLGHPRISLVAADGTPLISWSRPGAPEEPFADGLLSQALHSPEGEASTLVAADGQGPPRLHTAVSLRDHDAPGYVLALQVDLDQIFDDVVWPWPVPSATGETALLRRSGEEVLLFRGDRTAPGRTAALTRLPVDRGELVAVKAAGQFGGMVEGLGIRGHRVLAAVRPLAGTDWKLLSRMDLSEVEEPIRRPFAIMGGLLTSLLAAGALLLGLWWRHESARERMEAALRESHDLLQLALAGTHRVWDWDLAAGRLAIQRTGEEGRETPRDVYEGSVDEVLPRLVHPDDLEEVRSRLEAHVRGETPGFEVEARSVVLEGERWVLVRGRGSRRDASGRAQRVTGVVTDVTVQREMRAKLERTERLATIGELAAGVAHEINNPLAYVLSNLHFVAGRLKVEGKREEELEALEDARDGAERVRDVVRRLRSFSRPGEGPRVVTDVLAEIELAARLAGGEIHERARLDLRLGPMPRVEAGQHEIGQLLVNLLVNAAHSFPPDRRADDVITVEAGTDERGWARVEVRDTGEGIPPHVLRRVFEPFFTTKSGGKGTGLGMAIAQKIVAGAGGRIEIESQVGRGTTVRVALPPAEAPDEAAPAPRPGARRVLVVDGDPRLARSLARTIGEEQEVLAAGSASEALARLAAGDRFDAILCEVTLPEMTGAELYRRIAAMGIDHGRRVIFVSGGTYDQEAAAFLQHVENPCLEKPFDAQQLREALAWAAGTGGGGRGAGPAAGSPRSPEQPGTGQGQGPADGS